MKKTIIALMALAGIACGANQDIENLISTADYELGDAYTLEFTITGGVGDGHHTILTLTDNWTLNTEIGRYIGFSVATTNGIGGNYGDLTNTTRTNPFIASIAEDAEGWVYDSQAAGNLGDVVVTLAYNGGNTTALTLKKNGSTWVDATLLTAIDLTDVKVESAVSGVKNATLSVTSVAVPEPTTATLSLLALAGLAARRRRK